MKTQSLTISRRKFLYASSAAASCVLMGGLFTNSTYAQTRKPNVILIMTDQQSADIMSCRMGSRYINTPVMDSLAANGILFTRAYSSNPLSMPARSSLFTGMYTHTTGIQSNKAGRGGDEFDGNMTGGQTPAVKGDVPAINGQETSPAQTNVQARGWDKLTVMGTYFKNAGYETAYFGKWHLAYDKKNTTSHGFDIVAEGNKNSRGAAEVKSPDTQCAQAAVKFLSGKHDKPFLLVTSFLNPHNICEYARRLSGAQNQVLNCGEIGDPPAVDKLPPPPYNLGPQLNEPDGMTLLRRGYITSKTFPINNFTYDLWSQQRWGYYKMVEIVDREIGKVINALKEAGLEDNTIIVFTADHGECGGAHGWNQKTVFYDESVRVPLIISWKEKIPAATSDKLVEAGVDILPTILDLAGIDKPEELPGMSLKELAMGKKVTKWREYVVSENDLQQAAVVGEFKPTMEGRMLRTDRYKYCLYSKGTQRESLVDMQNDPGETKNLATDPAYRTILLQHRDLLRSFGVKYNDPLIAKLLENNVGPIPFVASGNIVLPIN